MARPNYEYTLDESGSIEIEKGDKSYNVLFTPSPDGLPRGHDNTKEFKKLIAQVNLEKTSFTFFPFKGRGLYSMHPKYFGLVAITVEIQNFNPNDLEVTDVEDILANLPDVFIENYNYGLGFLKKYSQIASFLGTLGVKHLYIVKLEPASYKKEAETMVINERDLRTLQKAIDKIVARASKVVLSTKRAIVAETLLELISQSSGHTVNLEKTNINENISKNVLVPLNEASRQKQSEAVEIVAANSKRMLKEQPSKLVKLRKDIDLVTLNELIKKFSEMIEQDLEEFQWQQLFEENPFILNMAFGVPIIKVRGNAYVGGRKIWGGGDKMADFLVKNSISNNAAIIEIKRPAAKLLGSATYRKDVYAPSTELSGAVNQLLDQIHKFQKNIAGLKEESRIYDIETYSVVGVLVVGRSSKITSEKKSFELFRGNSKNIVILTFDELLEKLKQLSTFLGADDSFFQTESDLPF
ncbi:MAG TPA: Shedu immune nuclease family protein [Chitinophagaceae bacterium]|nr:Shedu immune nuclease family protein [Chitinophagaceae bacterium]